MSQKSENQIFDHQNVHHVRHSSIMKVLAPPLILQTANLSHKKRYLVQEHVDGGVHNHRLHENSCCHRLFTTLTKQQVPFKLLETGGKTKTHSLASTAAVACVCVCVLRCPVATWKNQCVTQVALPLAVAVRCLLHS